MAASKEERCFLPWPFVVFQVAALGLERVVVFVLDLPARAATLGSSIVQSRRCNRACEGDLAPVDFQGAFGFDERDVIDIAAGVFFPVAVGVLDAQGDAAQLPSLLQQLEPLCSGGMGFGLAGEEEVSAQERERAAPTWCSNVRQAMSLSRPASLRQPQRSHSSRDNRVRFQVGGVASRCRTKPISCGAAAKIRIAANRITSSVSLAVASGG